MKLFFNRIIALFVIFVIVFSLSIPAFADYQSTANSWWEQLVTWGAQEGNSVVPFLGETFDFVGYHTTDSVCDLSGDHYHHADSIYGCSTGKDSYGTYANATCKYCGKQFKYYSQDLSATYRSSTAPGRGYYTVPSTTTVDAAGNTTNYYRSGDTTNMPISNSFNKTFNSFQNNSYTTNNNTTYYQYKANVDLSNFLNSYTYNTVTNNYDITYNNYTYNTTNNYYTYYLVDNSTTNYNYDVQVEYAPQYTQVTYVSNSSEVNNVTNIYYYELYDGRSSVDISVSEVMGMATDYVAGNYEMVIDDPDTLSLQHFDGSYEDSSSYQREFYSVNRSTAYVDSRDFGQALSLNGHHGVGVKIPELSTFDSVCVEFRMYESSRTGNLKFRSNGVDILTWNQYQFVLHPYGSSYISMSGSLIPLNTWNSYKIIYKSGMLYVFVNGDLVKSSTSGNPFSESVYLEDTDKYTYYLDELRVSTGSFTENTSAYTPAAIPFDTNKVLALPDHPEEGKIYVRSSNPVTNVRIGGVRPSNPSNGFVYVPLDKDYKGAGVQISDGTSWTDVDAYVYEMGEWHNVLGYRFLTVGDYGDPDPTDPTPSPSPSPGGDDGPGGDTSGILDKLGELFGTIIKGFGGLIGAVGSALLEALTSLAEMISNGFTQIVETVLGWFESIPALFSGFLGFLSAVFPFIPEDIMLLLTFGIAAMVFIGIIKAVRR